MALWQVVALSFFLELVEIAWQYSPSFEGTLQRIYALYRRSVFWLLLAHTGYLYLLFVSLRYDLLDWPIVVAIALKTPWISSPRSRWSVGSMCAGSRPMKPWERCCRCRSLSGSG